LCKELFSVDLGIGIDEETAKSAFVEYDAITTIKFADMEGFTGFLGSEEKKERLDSDGQRFVSAAKIVMGWDFWLLRMAFFKSRHLSSSDKSELCHCSLGG